MRASFLLLTLAMPHAAVSQPQAVPQHMSVSGVQQKANCAVTGVQGNVTIDCPSGTPKSTVELLNRQFRAQLQDKEIRTTDLTSEINDWKARYDKLLSHLGTPLAASASSSPPDGPDSPSALHSKAQELLKAGKLDEAGQVLDHELSGSATEDQLAQAHFDRASLLQLQSQPIQAVPHYQKAYSLRPDNPEYAYAYGDLLRQEHNYSEAESVLRRAVSAYRDLAKADPQAHIVELSKSLNALGLLDMAMGYFNEADEVFRESLAILRDLSKTDAETNLPRVATMLNNLGVLYTDQKRYKEAETALTESQQISRELAKSDPQANLPALAKAIANTGNLYSSAKRPQDAIGAYTQALTMYRDLSKTPAGIRKENLATVLASRSLQYTRTQQYQLAGDDLKEALSLDRTLVDSNPEAYLPSLAHTLADLGLFYSAQQQTPQAIEPYTESLTIYRDLARSNPIAYLHDVVFILNAMGDLYNNATEQPGLDSACRRAADTFMVLSIKTPADFAPKIVAVCPTITQ
jgi:tetratricopeptide (TPR) repeat protein